MDLNHFSLVAFAKSWGLFYFLGLSIVVLIYALRPANRKKFDDAANSILDKDNEDHPWQ